MATETKVPMVNIAKGETETFKVFLTDSNGRPFDLTSYDKFKLALPLSDGESFLTITEVANANGSKILKASPNILGQLDVTIGKVDSKLLKAAFGLDMDLEIDITASPAPRRKRIKGALNVEESNIA